MTAAEESFRANARRLKKTRFVLSGDTDKIRKALMAAAAEDNGDGEDEDEDGEATETLEADTGLPG